MIKHIIYISIILITTTFCSSPDKRTANGADTLDFNEPVFEKVSQKPNTTNNQGLPQEGVASYYANRLHGRPTASGEPYDTAKFTAAHMTLPLGTKVRVTNLRNLKSVEVTVNDRGPHHKNRIIDLSRAAARKIGFLNRGTVRVRIEEAE